MSRRMTRTDGRQSDRDILAGKEYVCCRGPLKGQVITVAGKCPAPMGDRYYLEAEGGRKWTISGDKLRRIFGDATERACGCAPHERTVASYEVSEVSSDLSTDDEEPKTAEVLAVSVKDTAAPETIHPKEKSTQARLW